MDAKPEHNAAPKLIKGRVNGRFAPGFSGNPGGSPEATRRAFNKRFLLDLAEDWQQHGREVFKRVRRESPAAYLKVCAMLVPREMKLEHSGGIKAMSTEQIERSIELIKEILAQREAGANAKLIDGEPVDAAALPAPDTRAG
jgi:DNA-binding PucR family transcriptional regulator